jgi:hypothetical protein
MWQKASNMNNRTDTEQQREKRCASKRPCEIAFGNNLRTNPDRCDRPGEASQRQVRRIRHTREFQGPMLLATGRRTGRTRAIARAGGTSWRGHGGDGRDVEAREGRGEMEAHKSDVQLDGYIISRSFDQSPRIYRENHIWERHVSTV